MIPYVFRFDNWSFVWEDRVGGCYYRRGMRQSPFSGCLSRGMARLDVTARRVLVDPRHSKQPQTHLYDTVETNGLGLGPFLPPSTFSHTSRSCRRSGNGRKGKGIREAVRVRVDLMLPGSAGSDGASFLLLRLWALRFLHPRVRARSILAWYFVVLYSPCLVFGLFFW